MRRYNWACWTTLLLLVGMCTAVQAAPVKATASDPVLARDGARAVLSLDGEWDVLPVRGLDLRYPPAATGWLKETEPSDNTRFIDTNRGPYMPNVSDLVSKDGSFVQKDKIAAWYRKRFTVTASDLAGKRAVLVFHGAAFRSTAYLNGKELGTSFQCAVPFEYEVTSAVRAGQNEVLVGLTGREGIVDVPNKCYVTPCNGMMAGLWGSVELQLRPQTFISDVFVRTSVKNKRIEMEVTVSNSGKIPLVGQLISTVVDKMGTPQCSTMPTTLTVGPGGTRKVTLSKDWIAPRLWSPESPALYSARVSLRQGSSDLDCSITPFGFREFEIRGRDFFLNGVRTVLFRNSTLINLGNTTAAYPEVRTTVTRPYNCVRLHIGQCNVAEMDACDQFGMMAIPESSFSWVDTYPSAAKKVWLANTLEFYRRWIRLHRNRPSVIMWSLCNETYWDRNLPEEMAIADQIIATVRESDMTRPLQGDGEVNWNGRLPTINIHYPEGAAGEMRLQYPNSGLVVPNDLWWLKKDGTNESWRAKFTWDRPLMLGEYWLMDGSPDRSSSFMGDTIYDWERVRYPPTPRTIAETEDMASLQKATDYYRMMGVACLNPWSGNRELFMRPIDVRPIDFHPNFTSGKTTSRKTVVFNDSTGSPYSPHLECRLSAGERTLWTGNIQCDTPPGSATTYDVPVSCPVLSVSTPAKLVVRLVEGHGWELGRYEETIYIIAPPSLAGVDPLSIVLMDATGRTKQALAKLGCTLHLPLQLPRIHWRRRNCSSLGK